MEERAVKAIRIAGGGLAGLSLGIALRRRGVPVELHEAGTYPRHRVCGEFINGVKPETLAALGVAPLVEDALSLTSSTWFRRGRQIYSTRLPEAALGISRRLLDQRMADCFVENGGVLHTRSRCSREDGEGFVWTAGRQVETSSPWLGLKVHVQNLDLVSDLEMHIGHGGYFGIARIEGGRANVCGLVRRRQTAGKGVDLMFGYMRDLKLGTLAERVSGAEIDTTSFTGVSGFRLGRQKGREANGCFLGDSDRMIPPFTGNGMSMALEAAELALDPLESYARGHESWDAARLTTGSLLARRFKRRLRLAKLMHPLLLSRSGSALIAAAARGHVLPFQTLYRLLR